MIELGGNTKLRKKVCQEIQSGVDGARGDDSNKMKPNAIDWLMHYQDDTVELASVDIPKRNKKTGRGFDSPVTGEFLRPIQYPADVNTYLKIKGGHKDFRLNGKQMPAFMYPRDHTYNKDDIEDGLLQGLLPVAAAKQIYQGPSAALQVPGYHRGKAGNAARNGQEALGPRDVGYVCTQLYFSLSALGSWAEQDGDFNYRDFFWAIVDIFKDGEGQSILDYFNHEVFGTIPESGSPEEPDTPVEVSDYDALAAQRAAKRSRLPATQ
ncbi:hypothetical protein B0H16DRAFT_1612525 [Mycena metata]|uniref:Uncharacterized protein n=1 Tax=Mycena metata TaxID=1033252 RepID=A0AAD7HBJ5_9AGAR|nr:hypothetical protein B0H16DRAFT_1612525 [Mycena metata]